MGLGFLHECRLTLTQLAVVFFVDNEFTRGKLALTKIDKSVGSLYKKVYLVFVAFPRMEKTQSDKKCC